MTEADAAEERTGIVEVAGVVVLGMVVAVAEGGGGTERGKTMIYEEGNVSHGMILEEIRRLEERIELIERHLFAGSKKMHKYKISKKTESNTT